MRFLTLGVQSYEADEAVTVKLLHLPFGSMISAIPHSESTPPLYYIVAWLWARVFGLGEVGLRSLSALLGTMTVAAVFVIADRAVGRRAAIAAAVLTAVNPFMFWFSQEARSYALLALLTTVSVGLFLALLARLSGRRLFAWALCCAAALATHYFAVFPVGAEAVWLLLVYRPGPPRLIAAIGLVVATAVALAPLALEQKAHAGYAPLLAASGSLGKRAAEIPKQFITGYNGPLEVALGVLGPLLAVGIVAWWWVRSSADGRRPALPFAVIGVVSVLAPVLLALAGLDFLIARNVIVAWAPLAILIAICATAPAAGLRGSALFVLLAAVCAGVLVSDLVNPSYQRDDWRDAAHALGRAPYARGVILTGPAAAPDPPGSPPPVALSLYLPGVRAPTGARTPVREIDYVGLTIHSTLSARRLPRSLPHPLPRPWRPIGRSYGTTFTVIRYRPPHPVAVRATPTRGLGGLPGQLLVVSPQRP